MQAQEENVPATEPDIAQERAVEPPVEESSAIDEAIISDEAELPLADEQPANRIEEFIAREDTVNYYLDAIEDAEAAQSAYSSNLAELYQGLGNFMLEQQNLEDAKDAFQQGIQIERVNYGLTSPTQTEYLFQLANIENIIGERESADELLDTIFTINAKHYGEISPEMLPVLRQLLAWYQTNRPMFTEYSHYEDIIRPVLLSTLMATIYELDKGIGHPETTAIYRGIGQTQWSTVKYLLSKGFLDHPNTSLPNSIRAEPRGGISVKSHVRLAREAFIKAAESVAKDPQRSDLEAAEALAQIGDWNLASGKRNASAKDYKEAYQLLVQSRGSTGLADEYFSRPVPLRFMDTQLTPVGQDPPSALSAANPVDRPLISSQRAVSSPLMEPTGSTVIEDSEVAVTDSQDLTDSMNDISALPSEPQVFTVSMTITNGGKPVKVVMVHHPQQITDDYVRKVKSHITRARFRPRLENGRPVKTVDFTWNIPMGNSKWLP